MRVLRMISGLAAGLLGWLGRTERRGDRQGEPETPGRFTRIPFTGGAIVAEGEPCGHPGCLNHVSHPCEGCGRIAGKWSPDEFTPKDHVTLVRELGITATCIDMGSCGECADDACPQRAAPRVAAPGPGEGCDKCSSPYCECDGTCDEDYGTACHRCDTWVCGYCVVEGACHDCFSKMQGGVN